MAGPAEASLRASSRQLAAKFRDNDAGDDQDEPGDREGVQALTESERRPQQ